MFWDLFRQVYRAPLVLLRTLLASPLSFFVYGIMSKWYIMVMLAAIMTTFWVFKGLEKSGALQRAEAVVSKALVECKAVAQHCTPLILDLPATWECVKNPPIYEKSEDEINLEKNVDAAMQHMPQSSSSGAHDNLPRSSGGATQANPYEQ